MCVLITDNPVDGVAVLTASLFILEAGLMMLQARGKSQIGYDAESEGSSEGSSESFASDPSVNLVRVYNP